MFDETIKNIEAEIEWIDYELKRQSTTQNQELRLKEKKNALFGIIEQMSIYQQRYGKSQTKK
ncbi:MAG: hypothetical protein GX587_06435 [Bacteroidales bacterium]|nr:hypothetical protein [Bacteroidales bacterium]